ncbi:MAG: fumarylacetoacetate hydrolase family protein [Pseudomonadales bacterium]|nr:fumarylacetoacetate hydrolase family protein [Pseudomonadales bacterium]
MSFRVGQKTGFGALVENRVVDLGRHMPQYEGLRQVLLAGALTRAIDIAAETSADYALKEIEFLPPIPDPEKILCVGLNYPGRADGEPRYPSIFLRTRDSLVGHGAPLWRPPESTQLDYEAEIALVIGTEGRRIAPERALDHIAGVTLMNDGTVRDWLRHSARNVTQGKNFEHSGAIGPWFVTLDALQDPENLEFSCSVNGEERQRDSTARLLFDFRYLVSYLSTFIRLKPGDVISTGSPAGSGADRELSLFLASGDVVEISAPEIGTLKNPVIDEPAVDNA